MSPPEYFITDVRRLEDRGDHFRLELGGRTPMILNILPGAFRELARRVLMGEDVRVM